MIPWAGVCTCYPEVNVSSGLVLLPLCSAEPFPRFSSSLALTLHAWLPRALISYISDVRVQWARFVCLHLFFVFHNNVGMNAKSYFGGCVEGLFCFPPQMRTGQVSESCRPDVIALSAPPRHRTRCEEHAQLVRENFMSLTVLSHKE